MKIILSLKRHHYMARVSIFLITVALIASMAGCAGESYALAIASTDGGSVTTPGEGMFTYGEGTVVNLVATPNAGYRFVDWTGDVGTIGNVTAGTTNITMNGDYFITANFVAMYDLTISSTAGGNVTIPGEGTFTYDAGTVVSLNATPDANYHFVNWTGNVSTIADVNVAATDITMNGNYFVTGNFEGINFMVSGGHTHTLGAKADGSVVAVGSNYYGQCNVGNWTDITQVSAGAWHTVGLKSDGTVVAMGGIRYYGECDVGNWMGIAQVATGEYHTVGLKADGTVVAVGWNYNGQCDVGDWTGITQVAASWRHTLGLRSDGTVVAVGSNDDGRCDVGNWSDITQVAAGGHHTVGLKSDGTVVAVGENWGGGCDVSGWTNIVQVATGEYHTVGLKSDGTVLVAGYNYEGLGDVSGWTNIKQIAAGSEHTVGLKYDGTVVAVGWNESGQCNVEGWDLN